MVATAERGAAGAQEPPVLRRVGDVASREKVGEDQGERGPLHAARIDQCAPDALPDPLPGGVGLRGGRRAGGARAAAEEGPPRGGGGGGGGGGRRGKKPWEPRQGAGRLLLHDA